MSLDVWLYVDTGAGDHLSSHGMNITHNVAPMWTAAGVYEALYESAGVRAGDTIAALRSGVARMETQPELFRALNPSNGWGDYESALSWLRGWLAECEKHPDARIGVSA